MAASSNPDAPVRLISGCKINLCLEITGQRPDGFHTLHSYFLPLPEPHDTLIVSVLKDTESPFCRVYSEVQGIDPENNTLTKAYRLFAEATPELPALQIELQKGVPHGSGLGGGSADAAALLNFLNSYIQKQGQPGLTQDNLLALGARVGADVPFFIIGKAAWVSGIGEVIRPDTAPLEPYRHFHLVLLCPQVHVSTQWAFKEWDKLEKAGVNALTTYGLHDSNNSADVIRFVNNLENPVFAAFPELKKIKEDLFELGAEKALMSGSGSSIFGLFASEDAAMAASRALGLQGLNVFVQPLYTGVSPSW